MNEAKVKGVVISSTDYREKDKLVEIFTLENGILTARLVGCKSANAKLKFAFQPFCFAEFIITEKNGFYSIISANLLDSFFDLTKNYDNFQNAFKMLEIINKIMRKNNVNQDLFLLLLKCLNAICYENVNSKKVLIKFIIEVYLILGYGFNFNECADCQNKFDTKRYLKNFSSEFVCSLCKDSNSTLAENGVFNALKIISNCDIKNLKSVKLADKLLQNCEKLLIYNFENVFNVKL